MNIKGNLVVDFDISNPNSFIENEFKIKSTSKWNESKINNIYLSDYGLTQYDIGKASSLLENKLITSNDNYLTLDRIGKPDQNGNVSYDDYELLILSGSTVGTFLYSNGGYLNNPFKYHDYGIEYLPRQYKDGFTIETTLFIDNTTFTDVNRNSNIFFFIGTRAEDKFVNTYSGNDNYFTFEGSSLENSNFSYDISKLKENTQNIDNVITYLKTDLIYVKTNNSNEFLLDYVNNEDFTLILNQNKLIKDTDYIFDLREKKLTLKEPINTTDTLIVNYYSLLDTEQSLVNIDLNQINNKNPDTTLHINNNALCFKFNENKQIGYRKINSNLNIEEKYSTLEVNYSGWIHVIITFDPYIKNIDNINDDCEIKSREGVLKIFVNGINFLTVDNFLEPSLNAFKIDRSKQIGVPYNISWGGGTFGLKHSYNFNGTDFDYPYQINENNNNLLIENNFDGYFKGGFQKLRIYNKSLNLNEIKYNYNIESKYYSIVYNKGGRIIFKTPTIDQNNNLMFINGVWDDNVIWNDNNIFNL